MVGSILAAQIIPGPIPRIGSVEARWSSLSDDADSVRERTASRGFLRREGVREGHATLHDPLRFRVTRNFSECPLILLDGVSQPFLELLCRNWTQRQRHPPFHRRDCLSDLLLHEYARVSEGYENFHSGRCQNKLTGGLRGRDPAGRLWSDRPKSACLIRHELPLGGRHIGCPEVNGEMTIGYYIIAFKA
jgi:hypothetical protein